MGGVGEMCRVKKCFGGGMGTRGSRRRVWRSWQEGRSQRKETSGE